MAETTVPSWSIRGDYFETCNCKFLCPCPMSPSEPLTAMPTEGVCKAGFAFHLDRGSYGAITLDGLNAVLVIDVPGPMADGNWTAALYLDERANDQQREALQAIFSGAAGGVLGGLAPLISKVAGVKSAPIAWQKEGKRRSVEIPNVMRMAVQAVPSIAGPDAEAIGVNVHPFNTDGVVFAVGEAGSTWADYGMRWDNSGRNGVYASINWSNA